MSAKYFVDTNILVYALDAYDQTRQDMARQLLHLGGKSNRLILSTQVLQEFYVTATRKLKVDEAAAKQMVSDFALFDTVTITVDLIKEAVDCSSLSRISFWDALIIVAAEAGNCTEVWSEGLNDGQIIRGALIRNPFEHFDDLVSQF